ncbi:MAG TPA: hypothetical protein VM327_07775 [Candidatus Thermoplasmatota archaeon]|nr:hypothetical protein [Candidatus Thermoplasmatota archaeon]
MDRLRLAVAAALFLASLAAPPSSAVSDDAFLAFSGFSLGGADFADGAVHPVEAFIDLVATQDAPEGRIAGRIQLEAWPANGTGDAAVLGIPFEVEVGTGASRSQTIHQVGGHLELGPGLYNVTATLVPEGNGGPWDSTWRWYQAGYTSRLGTGWGRADFPSAASFDVDGDGADDVWLTANGTDKPAPRPLTVSEGTQKSPGGSGMYCGRHLWFDLSAVQVSPTDVRVAAPLVDRLLTEGGTLRMDTQARGGDAPPPVDGFYEVTVGHQYAGTPSDYVLFSETCPDPAALAPHVWGHGFRTTANVTHWDLDEDGAMDVRFWHTDASSVEGARNETTEERRATELVLIAQAHVEQRTTRRTLTFELARPGGGHEGAWVEIQDAAGLFRELLGAPDNASVSYRLSLPANESFVEQDGNTTWAWIGHFSTQTLTVLLDDAGAPDEGKGSEDQSTTEDASSSSSSSRPVEIQDRRSPIAGQGMLAALAAVAAALVARQALDRR